MSNPEPTGNDETVANKQNTTEKEKTEPESDLKASDSLPDPPSSVTHHHITYRPGKDWWDKAKPFVEIAGALLLLIYTFYTIKMYCANKQAADAAASAARTAAETLNRATEQFRIDERAWIEIERIERVQVGEAFRYRLYLRNVGKTAAHSIVMNAARSSQTSIALESNADGIKRMQDTILQTSLPKEARENPVPKVIAPETTAAVPFVMDGQAPQIFAKDEWVSYLIGRADYTDDFGVAHWMKFCFYVGEANGNLWNCHEGNDEDRNPEIPPK